jgi:hypothetical protein
MPLREKFHRYLDHPQRHRHGVQYVFAADVVPPRRLNNPAPHQGALMKWVSSNLE